MKDLQDQKYFVVGGSSGIGLGIVHRLVERGADVTVFSRHKSDELGSVRHEEVDISKPLDDSVPIPDSLAGIAYCPGTIRLGSFRQLSDDDYLEDFTVNVLGGVRIVRAALKSLRKDGGASLVFFSTVAVATGLSFHASVSASKGAVEGLARTLAAELAGKGVRANVIAPSMTDTPLADKFLSSEKKREAAAGRHPLGRVGTVDDIASMAVFLLSPESGWITGQVIGVDGGLGSVRP